MNLTATFPTGVTETTVHGLHQWDYGRQLEIKSPLLTSSIAVAEVHFAPEGTKEDAVVRTCAVASKKITAAIPDEFLEQAATVLAWVYIPTEAEGYTVLKVTMPVIARAKPAELPTEPPEDYSNQYTDLIAAANAVLANTYSRSDIEAALGAYITDVDALIGGDA